MRLGEEGLSARSEAKQHQQREGHFSGRSVPGSGYLGLYHLRVVMGGGLVYISATHTPFGALVARPVVFLASEYDGFITGATIDINGGVLGC